MHHIADRLRYELRLTWKPLVFTPLIFLVPVVALVTLQYAIQQSPAHVLLAASEMAIRATDRCMRVLGASGLIEETPMERLFRDARLGPFSPLSNEMARNFVGERLGLSRTY